MTQTIIKEEYFGQMKTRTEGGIGQHFCKDEEQRIDERGIFHVHSGKWNHGVLYRWCRCYRLCEVHMLQHAKSWLYGARFL